MRRLGAGAMGVVYLARDLALDRLVALKTFPELRPHAIERLRAEARAMAALNHDGLAIIYGLELWHQTPILVMEYFAEGTLARRIAGAPLPARDVAHLGMCVARALADMHARGRLHRDLKPSNIGLTANGDAKLLDFGLATAADADDEALDAAGKTNVVLAGTPAYLPPEAFQGEVATPGFDVWGLAVTLLESAAGAHPFAAPSVRGVRRRILSLDLAPFLARRLASTPLLIPFFERALSRSPASRFGDARELHRALESLLPHLDP